MGIKVMLADGQTLVRKGIRALLEKDGTAEVVEEAEDGLECMEKLSRRKMNKYLPDILILDSGLTGKDSIQVLQEIRNSMPEVSILVLTDCRDTDCVSEAVREGAHGYLPKNVDIDEFIRAVRKVADGGKYIPPEPDRMPGRECREKIKLLTHREIQILIQVLEGKANKEIADHFKIREQTVKNHLSKIFRKIDVSDRTQAVIFCIKNHLRELGD